MPLQAILRAVINGGAPQTGGITAAASATCQLSADPSGTSGAFAYKYEILDYPIGYAQPSGWSTDANGVYFSTAPTPPIFTLPATSLWGKFMLRLTLNNGISPNPAVFPTSLLFDTSTDISVESASGFRDLGFNEAAQFNALKEWVGDHKHNLRVIAAFVESGGGGGLTVTGTAVAGYAPIWNGTGAVWAPTTGIMITGFAPTVALVETSQSVVHPAFTASYNVTPSTALVTNNANAESLDVHTTPTSFASAQTYQKTTPNQSVVWTLNAGLSGLSASPSTTQVVWCARNYWGISTTPANTAAFIQALASNALATTRAESFTVNATSTNRIYFACPTRYGTPTFAVGGFAGGFTLRATGISVTNAQSFSENFDLYESVSAGLGTVAVGVI